MNLLNTSDWYSSLTGSTAYFQSSGGALNTRVLDTDMFGNNVYMWQSSGQSSSTTAGFSSVVPVFDDKTYRFSFWIKRIGGSQGDISNAFYFLASAWDSNFNKMVLRRVDDGLESTGHYFMSRFLLNAQSWTNDFIVVFPENTWRLCVGYILPYTYENAASANYYSYVYDLSGNTITDASTGKPYRNIYNYQFLSGATYASIDNYAPYEGDATYKIVYPRIDVVDGTEPSISTLISEPYYDNENSRRFAYNSGAQVENTIKVGDLTISTYLTDYSSTSLNWWNGPDERLGFVIAYPVPAQNHPTQIGNIAGVGFKRSNGRTMSEFISLVNNMRLSNSLSTLNTISECLSWLDSLNYWYSWGQ